MNVRLIAIGSRPWELWTGYWGFSALVDGTVLFDTFSSWRVLSKRLSKAGVRVEDLAAVVVSHDHRDHVGGLWGLLEHRKGLRVYLPEGAEQEVKDRIRTMGGLVMEGCGVKTVTETIVVSEELAGRFGDDRVAEQALVLKTPEGPVLLVGCSHPGIVNMVERAEKTFGVPVRGVIGGLHLKNASAEEAGTVARQLKAKGLSLVVPTHCTGLRAERIFRKTFGTGFLQAREGRVVCL